MYKYCTIVFALAAGCSWPPGVQYRQTVNSTWPRCGAANQEAIQYTTRECLRNSGVAKHKSRPELGKSCYIRAMQWYCEGKD